MRDNQHPFFMTRIFLSFLILLVAGTAQNPLYGQFYTVSKQRKVASVQSTSEIRQAGSSVDADGVHPDSKPEKPAAATPLENINQQKTGLPVSENVKPAIINNITPTDTVQEVRDSTGRILFCPPLDQLEVTSHYGYRQDPFSGKRKFHYGTDFRTASHRIYAMLPGRIKKIGYNKVLGNYIELEHGEFDVVYAHLYTVSGQKGESVAAGQCVGISGSTGRSTGDHLHVSMRYRNKSIDPYPLIKYISDFTTGNLPAHLMPKK